MHCSPYLFSRATSDLETLVAKENSRKYGMNLILRTVFYELSRTYFSKREQISSRNISTLISVLKLEETTFPGTDRILIQLVI